MVPAILDQVAHQEADCLAAEPASLPGRAEEDVDARAVVLRVGDLLVGDRARDRPVHVDCEQVAVPGRLEITRSQLAPPAPHARLRTEGRERLQVGGLEWSQSHAGAAERGRGGHRRT